MANRNIEINYKTNEGYDILYPNITARNVIDFNDDVNLILKNSTKALYGLGNEAVPDDVLAFLGKYAQYWWMRRTVKLTPKNSESTSSVEIIETGGRFSVLDVPNGDSLIINSVDSIEIQSPSQLSVSYNTYTEANKLKGKYFKSHRDFDGESFSKDVYYLPPEASNVTRSGDNPYYVRCNAYTVYAETQYGDWEYVQSSDRNAYPDNGESGGYEYQFLGIPFDNAVEAPKFATGSYVGTGTAGKSGPNTLTFPFEPKMVVITAENPNNGTAMLGPTAGFSYLTMASGNNTFYMAVTVDQTSISWYTGLETSDGSYRQMNNEYNTYSYVAIG